MTDEIRPTTPPGSYYSRISDFMGRDIKGNKWIYTWGATKKRIAYHEAGHLTMYSIYGLPATAKMGSPIPILAMMGNGPHVNPRNENSHVTLDGHTWSMIVAAGNAAEMLVFGNTAVQLRGIESYDDLRMLNEAGLYTMDVATRLARMYLEENRITLDTLFRRLYKRGIAKVHGG